VTSARTGQGAPANTVGGLVASASSRLHSEAEARWIVAQAADIPPGTLLTALDRPVSESTVDAVRVMAERRAAGEPLQYVLGAWSFRHLEIMVDPRALVPRPETEQTAEVALEELRRIAATGRRRPGDPVVVVDLGTGSGVIAMSIALEAFSAGRGDRSTAVDGPSGAAALEVWATDASSLALGLAGANLATLAASHPVAASRVRLAQGWWFDALPGGLAGHVDVVVSNPPYVSADEWCELEPQIRDHEPRTALVAGTTGLEALELLVDQARRWVAPGGSLVLELAPHQAGAVTTMAEGAGYLDVRVRPDLAGRARILVARWPDA
jgi:release factor glutamine methyltransferase